MNSKNSKGPAMTDNKDMCCSDASGMPIHCNCKTKSFEERVDIVIDAFLREYFVPLYRKDKPISEMTPYEQGLFRNFPRFLLKTALLALVREEVDNARKEWDRG